jgi:hypothetical protein
LISIEVTDGFMALDMEWRITCFNETGARMIGMRLFPWK